MKARRRKAAERARAAWGKARVVDGDRADGVGVSWPELDAAIDAAKHLVASLIAVQGAAALGHDELTREALNRSVEAADEACRRVARSCLVALLRGTR